MKFNNFKLNETVVVFYTIWIWRERYRLDKKLDCKKYSSCKYIRVCHQQKRRRRRRNLSNPLERVFSVDSFLDHEIDIEISISISRSYNFASFSSWPSSRDINHSHSHQRYVYSINIAVQSARTGLQLFGGRNLDVTLYFAELESRNSERQSSVDEQVNSRVCSLHWDWFASSLHTINYYCIIRNYKFTNLNLLKNHCYLYNLNYLSMLKY